MNSTFPPLADAGYSDKHSTVPAPAMKAVLTHDQEVTGAELKNYPDELNRA
jgi:hypothetical protein